MDALKKAISTAKMDNPYSSHMRNYLATHRFIAYRQTESNYKGNYCVTLTLRDRGTARQLLFVKREGNAKNALFEECYKEAYEHITGWRTQGLDSNEQSNLKISTDDTVRVSDKKENVIIEGADTRETTVVAPSEAPNLIDWSTTEGTYEFTSGEGSIMARWMPLDSVVVDQTTATRQPIWTAKIIEDIAALKNINILPVRGFMLGKFDVEFKLVLQATPFQACSLMLSWCPHPYGLIDHRVQVGVEATATHLDNASPKTIAFRNYFDVTTAVQRPNVIVDVSAGGEAVLRVGQKFHRTFIRNFDYDRVEGVNMGIRGGYQSMLMLHQLTPVMVGTGTSASFTARVFYRFVEAQLTAMTQPVEARTTSRLPPMYAVPFKQDTNFLTVSSDKAEEAKRANMRAKFRTQGPVMSALSLIRGVGMTATGVIASVEAISAIRGVRPRNRDKPNDVVGQMVVSPRPRPNFTNGEGVDHATVIGLSFAELTSVLENFPDEPESYKDFVNISGLFTTLEWHVNKEAGTNLWTWNGHPTDSGDPVTLSTTSTLGMSINRLFTPMSIASSGFTNYAGTIKLYFQFVKTMFHKGAIEVSIQYGRELLNNALENSYVKVINLQDCAGFEMIFPYIYDTPMRAITGTATPQCLPSPAFSSVSAMTHSARITIRVLNKLVAPDTVANYVRMLVWVKGGEDFVLNFPRPYNTTVTYSAKDPWAYTPQVIPVTVGQTVPIQRAMVMVPTDKFMADINTPNVWRTQGNGEEKRVQPQVLGMTRDRREFLTQGIDFNEPKYGGNRLTNVEHMNFKTILKMPLKLIKQYEYKAELSITVAQTTSQNVERKVQNYMFLPVAPVNSTLLQYLDNNWSTISSHANTSGAITQSHQYQVNSMFGMFSGSLVYTIIVESDVPVYYAYLPHDYSLRPMKGHIVPWTTSGVVTFQAAPIAPAGLFNVMPVQIGGSQQNFDIASSGIFNGMIIPQVNPTERIVVPMSVPLNWLLMNRGLIPNRTENGMYTMREQAEWFNGHLCFWSSKDCKITVYISCGDNFELGGFIGHVGVANPFVPFAISDDRREKTGVYNESTKSSIIKYQTQGLVNRPYVDYSDFETQGFLNRDLTEGWKSLRSVRNGTILAAGAAWLYKYINPEEPIPRAVCTAVAIYGAFEILHGSYRFVTKVDEEVRNAQQFVQGITDVEYVKECVTQVSTDLGRSVEQAVANVSATISQQVTLATGEAVTGVTEQLRESISDVKGIAAQEIQELIARLFPSATVVKNLSSTVWQVTQHLVHVALAQQWKTAAWATFCIMQELDLVRLGQWKRVKEPLVRLFERATVFSTQGPEVNTWTALMQVLTAIVCARMQVKADHGIRAHLLKIFSSHDYRTITGLNSILSLVKNIMTALSTLIGWATKEKDANVALIQSLQNQGGELYEFVQEANLFLTHFTEADFAKREGRIRHLATILRAVKIREMLLRVSQPQTTGPVLSLCTKVIDKAAKCQYLMKCDVVKMEPYVFYLAGDPKCGKSFLMYDIVPQLFAAIGVKPPTVDFMFTVTSGIDYCNGLRSDHLAWLFDDAWNLLDEESFRKLAQFFYALVTSAPFNAPRAELENKEQLAQPILVAVATNNPYPVHNMLACHKAIWRRRNCLWRVVLKNNTKIEDWSTQQLANFEHVEFYRYLDVCNRDSPLSEAYSYMEFIGWLIEDFKQHHAREQLNQRKKYESLTKCLDKSAIDELSLDNPFDIMNKLQDGDISKPITELLEEEVQKLLMEIDRNKLLSLKVSDSMETQGFGDVAGRVTRWIENRTLRCGRCGSRASSGGVAMWCGSGHYLCLNCSSALHRIDGKNIHMCAMHPDELVTIEDCGIINVLISRVVDDSIGVWQSWYELLKDQWTNKSWNTCKNFLIFLYGLRRAIKCWNRYSTQGKEQIEEIGECSYTYNPAQLRDRVVNNRCYSLQGLRPSPDRRSDFIYTQTLGMIPLEAQYVCQHSMLHCRYYYSDLKYSVIDYEESFINDEMCDGICALADVRFLNAIKTNLIISEHEKLYYDQMNRRKWPKFFWIQTQEDIEKQRDIINGLLAKPWWEVYILSKESILYKIVKTSIPILTLFGLVWGSVKVASGLWNWISTYLGLEVQSKGGFSGEVRTRASVQRVKRAVYSTQSAIENPTDNYNNKLNKIVGNYVLLRTTKFKCTAWGVHGSTFVMPNHLVSHLLKHTNFELLQPNSEAKPYKIHTSNIQVSNVSGRDIASITIKKGKILFKDCRKFLQTSSLDKSTLQGKSAKLLEVGLDDIIYDVDLTIDSIVTNSVAYDEFDNEHVNEHGVMYNYQSPGMCGSLLCVDSVNPVVSLHISGSRAQNKGIGCILYQEDFETQGLSLYELEGEPDLGPEFVGQPIGYAEEGYSVFIPEKTTIRPSLLEPLYENPPTTRPAFLSKKEPGYPHQFSPFYYGVLKNGKPTEDFPEYVVEKAMTFVENRMLAGVKGEFPYQIFGMEEAIMGCNIRFPDMLPEEESYMGMMELSTSAGWPYSTSAIRKKYGITELNKKQWIQVEFEDQLPSYAWVHPYVIEQHKDNMYRRERNMPVLNVFQDCLKDERRKLEKAYSEGGTRLFSMSNIEGTIALRKYTLSLVSHLRYNRINNSVAIGINPDSMEWTILYNSLTKTGNTKFFTTDFTNFGAGLNFYVGMKFADLIIEFCHRFKIPLRSVDHNVIFSLIYELMGSYHIAGDVIYKTIAGSPSGAAITGEINSFVHLMYITICWIIIGEVIRALRKGIAYDKYPALQAHFCALTIPKLEFTLEELAANVCMVVYGDDGTFSVSDEYCEYFNAETINLVLGEHGIAVTDASKKKEILKYGPIETVSFLKRSFRQDEAFPSLVRLSAMSMETVSEVPRWIRQKPLTPEAATRENCEAALRLIWGHGEKVFDDFKAELNYKLIAVGLMPILLTWCDIAHQFYPDFNFQEG